MRGKRKQRTSWKRRIKDSIVELRRHVNILETSKQGKLKRKEKYTRLERKYNIRQKVEKVVIEELKQRLQAKTAKLKRYEQRIHRYQVNRLFQQDQKRVYQQMNGTSSSAWGEKRTTCLSWYVRERESEEALLRKVGDSNVVNISEAVDPKQYKVNEAKQTENEWKQKRMHGQYVREKEGIDWDRTWQWTAKGDLKGYTEALTCSSQEQALRTNYMRFHIDHTAESPLCRMCGSKGETVAHVLSECSKLAQTM